jgi:hypothetical protein
MHYESVTMQQGRVQLDTDWDEMSELQLHPGLVYLDVWQRDAALGADKAGGSQRSAETGAESPAAQGYGLRLINQVTQDGDESATLHAALGTAASHAAVSFRLPAVEISVDGLAWERVGSLSQSGPQDKVYVLSDGGGLSSVTFGDGKHGARPPVGSRVVASYSFSGQEVAPGPAARRTRPKRTGR